MFLSAGIATSITAVVFCSLSANQSINQSFIRRMQVALQ